jgi:DNA-directed RNA polymerase subunit M/transcription elongation factor TFIIS
MVSIFTTPLTFDNKKNEILYSPNKIEWKKQVATVSLKKGFTPEKFPNEKILTKLEEPASTAAYVFAKFKYIPEDGKNNEIYLACIPSGNNKVYTDLYYESHIPANNRIINLNILDNQKKTITRNAQYLRVKGNVLAFCMDIATYYLAECNLDEYIDFVQMQNEYATDAATDEDEDDDDDCSEMDSDDNEDSDTSDDEVESEEEDNEPTEDNVNEEASDEEDEQEDEQEDEELEDTDEEAGEDVDAEEADEEADEDVIEEETEEEEAEVEAEEEALDDEENAGVGDEIDDEPLDTKPTQTNNKRKKTGSSKSIKFNAGLDTSVLFNILKKEDEKKLVPDAQLHLKRRINITILKLLDLPMKTIQYIEKGIYNYVIEKCSAESIIPIWDNPEFNDMYVSKSKSIYSNLNTKCYVGNKELLEKVKIGKINPYELAFLDSYKLYPEKWNDIIEEKAKMDKMLKESLKESATDLFQCSRCKKRKTIYCEVQTRSSDEPMTKFITCLECGYKWKQY